MFYALRSGLALIVIIVVLQMFLPDLAARIVELITQVIDLMLYALDQAQANLPQTQEGL